MRIELLLGIIILLFLIGCQTQNTEVIVTERDNIDVPQPLPLSEGNTASILPVSTDSENTETIPPEPLILSGSPVIFYTAHLGKDSDILPVQIQEVSPEGEDLGGRGELIKVETDYYGIMGYFPQYEKNYLIHKTYSPSYASSFIYPLTHNGKLFLLQDWGVDEGKNEVKNGWILDPKTGEQLQSLSFSGDAAQIALVQDRIYYRSTTGEDIYGKRSSGGDLYLLELGSSSRVLLEYGDESNGGRLLGGDQLYSYGNGQLRTHDLEGNIVETHTLLSNEEDYTFYSGETGVWYTVKNYGLSGIPAPPDEMVLTPYRLVSYNYRRQLPEVKTTDYLMAIWLQPWIKEQGAHDVLYHWDGAITECPRSNFFIVTQEDVIVTADTGMLKGVTRANILQVASKHFKVEERTITLNELHAAKEAFIASSTKRIIPVSAVDNIAFGSYTDTSVAKKLFDELRLLENAVLTKV